MYFLIKRICTGLISFKNHIMIEKEIISTKQDIWFSVYEKIFSGPGDMQSVIENTNLDF